jgi:OPT family oligopeptide transporter
MLEYLALQLDILKSMKEEKNNSFEPYVPASNTSTKEFTLRAIVLGALFGILFGAATVYLALKAGLTVSASIPIAVLAISLGRRFLNTTILENNIIQTAGSAGESVAAGVVFTLPAFLFLSDGVSKGFFNYWTILMLAIFGGILGVLMMIPLRKSLIVKEHNTLPYPEGTACAHVLVAGEKGSDFAKPAYLGLAFSFGYALLQKVFRVIAESPSWLVDKVGQHLPAARVSGEITPEYLGVGYIIGPRIAGVLVAGGVLAWLGLIPLLATLVSPDLIAAQLDKLNLLAVIDPLTNQLKEYNFGWDPVTHSFKDLTGAIYKAYVRQIGAGAVAGAGFITLIKTIPTIVSSFKESVSAIRNRDSGALVARTDNDLSLKVVGIGSLALVILMAVLPGIPGTGFGSKLLIGLLVIIFGFFFVTVSSRIVGIIGSSNNPISGMTIATIMGTALVFIGVGWSGRVYEPMALVVGSMICIAAANAGATSQDLKTGYIVGATPRYQQLALFIGVIVSSMVIGLTVLYLDRPTAEEAAKGIQHTIGTKYDAPQATLMATLIKGLLSNNLDWQFVLVGLFISITLELCNVKSLSFAVGLYLPLATTLPIWIGGQLKALTDWLSRRKGEQTEDADLGKGSLFATGLVAGGALAGVVVALLQASDATAGALKGLSAEEWLSHRLGTGGYMILGVLCFAALGAVMIRIARSATPTRE